MNNLNSVLSGSVFIDKDNPEVYDFLKENLDENLTPRTKEINGYSYKNSDIIRRNKSKRFYLVEKESRKINEFVHRIQDIQQNNARSVIREYVQLNETPKTLAEEYILDLRDEQAVIVESIRDKKMSKKKLKKLRKTRNSKSAQALLKNLWLSYSQNLAARSALIREN